MHDIEGSSWVKERYDDHDHWVDGLSMARSNIEVCGVNNVATNSINRWANLIIIDTWYLSSLSFTVVVHDVHLVYLIGRLIVPGLLPPLCHCKYLFTITKHPPILMLFPGDLDRRRFSNSFLHVASRFFNRETKSRDE